MLLSETKDEEAISKIEKLFDAITIKLDFKYEDSESFATEDPSRTNQTNKTIDEFIEDKFKFLNSFMKDFPKNIIDLPETKEGITDEYIGYCFPDALTFQKYHKEIQRENPLHKNNYVNISTEAANAWMNNFITDICENNTKKFIRIIGGKVGSGKSAFVKYLSIAFQEELVSKNVMVVPIHYKSFDVDVKTHADRDWNIHLETQILDGILLNTVNKYTIDVSDVETLAKIMSGINNTEEDRKRELFNSIDTVFSAIEVGKVRQALMAKVDNGRISNKEIRKLDSASKAIVIDFFKNKWDIKFLIVFDGLDEISIPAIIQGKYKEVFEALSEIIIARDFLNDLPDVYINYLIMLRHCSYEKFMERNLRENEVDYLYHHLVPAGLPKIFKRGINYYLSQNIDKPFLQENKDNFIDYGDQLINLCSDAFNIPIDCDLGELFDYNYRKLLRFFSQVTKFIINKLAASLSPPRDFDEFVAKFIAGSKKKNLLSKYDLYEIMMLDKHPIFRNYYSFTTSSNSDTKPQTQSLDQRRGYIDNIYNYHLLSDTANKTPMLLFKIRILQILSHPDKYKSISDISAILRRFGYICSDHVLSLTLDIMMNSGFVKVKREDGHLKYNATNVAKHLISYFAFEFRYFEYTVHATLFSQTIVDDIKSDNKLKGFVQWYYSSIINVFIFTMYISCVENHELRYIQENNTKAYLNKKLGNNWLIANKSIDEVKLAVKNILGSKVDGTRYLNADKLFQDIETIVNGWNELGIVEERHDQIGLFS